MWNKSQNKICVYKNWKECGRKLITIAEFVEKNLIRVVGRSLGQELGVTAISEVSELPC
jgi:hypothetical protein